MALARMRHAAAATVLQPLASRDPHATMHMVCCSRENTSGLLLGMKT